jgi:hypothetical protein
MVTRVFRHRSEILQALEESFPKTTLKLIALYSSNTNQIIADPLLMRIPITDQLVEG